MAEKQSILPKLVRIVLEGVDKYSNLIGSVYYPDGESAKDLGLELIENGYAKYVDWSGKVKGQGTGTIFLVTLVDPESDVSVNASLLKEGLARMEKRKRWEPKDKQQALDELEKYQTEARDKRLAMWEYGDVESDDEDSAIPARKAAGKR
ncbi:hypothetical protein HAX54_038347 [Datura stramonium]|uniref:TNase-like domain-containing protein n=1 Tax=Datura stramonium TaxID=4076 RepID=A0ABS8SHS7_DATST|nr:hypothetical protein [Datura stramonium]